jgi:hypothetical protein
MLRDKNLMTIVIAAFVILLLSLFVTDGVIFADPPGEPPGPFDSPFPPEPDHPEPASPFNSPPPPERDPPGPFISPPGRR